jgi:hypothetical protein
MVLVLYRKETGKIFGTLMQLRFTKKTRQTVKFFENPLNEKRVFPGSRFPEPGFTPTPLLGIILHINGAFYPQRALRR